MFLRSGDEAGERGRDCAATALGRSAARRCRLASALQSEDRGVRLSAIHALSRVDPRTRKAAAPLIGVLAGDDEELRVAAARALGEMGDEAGEAVPALLEASKADDDLGPAARDALQKIRKAPRSTAPALVALLRDAEPHVRLKAAEFLCEMEQGDGECLAALLELVKRRDTKVRQQSALLARYGSVAREAVPALIEVVRNDTDQQTRLAAVAALGAVSPDARPALKAALAGVPQLGDRSLAWAIEAAPIMIQEEDPPPAATQSRS